MKTSKFSIYLILQIFKNSLNHPNILKTHLTNIIIRDVMSIFRAYDIRGIYPNELNGVIAYKIGLAFGKFIGKSNIALGMDVRKSSPEIKKHLVKGLLASGLNVIDFGVIPTPLLYFAVAYKELDGGAMITGSHNPKEYNGIKLCGKNGLCFSYETGIGEIEKMVSKDIKIKYGKKGKMKRGNIEKEYIDFVLQKINLEKKLKIVIDAGNGTAGKVSSKLFQKMGCEVVELFCEPNGDFPNHHPDPLVKENLETLKSKVKEVDADIGIAYDGDGDRVGFVDDKGNVVENNKVFALLIKSVLEKNHEAKIAYEVLASKLVEDVILMHKGVPIISRVGHSYIQNIMKEEGCLIGGETSGHYYFKENFNYDDGIFASAKLVEIVSKKENSFSSLIESLPKYITSDDTRVYCPDNKKFKVVEYLRKKFEGLGKLITIDGVKVIEKDKWFIVRASNTQPALVLRWEAKKEKDFNDIRDFILEEVKKAIESV